MNSCINILIASVGFNELAPSYTIYFNFYHLFYNLLARKDLPSGQHLNFHGVISILFDVSYFVFVCLFFKVDCYCKLSLD